MAVEKAALDLYGLNPIAASRMSLERTLAEFQQLCDHVPCRTLKRKLKKNIGKIEVTFDGVDTQPAPPVACEKKAKARK